MLRVEMPAEMFAVAEIDRGTGIVAGGGLLEAVGADQGDLKRRVADERGSLGPAAQVEMGGIVFKAFAQQKQGTIESIEYVHGALLEQPHQAVGLLHRCFDRLVALKRRHERDDEPACRDQYQSRKAGWMQRGPQGCQEFAVPGHRPGH
jgi:hypothetical protein